MLHGAHAVGAGARAGVRARVRASVPAALRAGVTADLRAGVRAALRAMIGAASRTGIRAALRAGVPAAPRAGVRAGDAQAAGLVRDAQVRSSSIAGCVPVDFLSPLGPSGDVDRSRSRHSQPGLVVLPARGHTARLAPGLRRVEARSSNCVAVFGQVLHNITRSAYETAVEENSWHSSRSSFREKIVLTLIHRRVVHFAHVDHVQRKASRPNSLFSPVTSRASGLGEHQEAGPMLADRLLHELGSL